LVGEMQTQTEESPTPIVAFLHIPKSAGRTVGSVFTELYTRDAVAYGGNGIRKQGAEDKTEKFAARARKPEVRVMRAKVPFGLFLRQVPEDARFVTFLREPIDRVLSQYHRHVYISPDQIEARQRKHARRVQKGRENPSLSTRGRRRFRASSLEEAFANDTPVLENLTTRFLAGIEDPVGALPPDALERAKDNLRKFFFVGLVDRFDESVVLLLRSLAAYLVPYRRRGTNGTKPEVTDEERALIADHNRLDLELFSFATELFEKKRASLGPDLEGDVGRLRQLVAEMPPEPEFIELEDGGTENPKRANQRARRQAKHARRRAAKDAKASAAQKD